jgi:hypothetical protein
MQRQFGRELEGASMASLADAYREETRHGGVMRTKFGIPEEELARIRARDKRCVYCRKEMTSVYSGNNRDYATIEHLNLMAPSIGRTACKPKISSYAAADATQAEASKSCRNGLHRHTVSKEISMRKLLLSL